MLRVRGEDSRGGSLSFMESNGVTWCYVIEYHATRSAFLSVSFSFLFFFSFHRRIYGIRWRPYLSEAQYYRRKNYYRKKRKERTMHQTRPRSRGLFVHRVYVYRARIARKGYEVNDRNTGGRESVVEKVSRFLAILRVRLRYPVYEVAKSISRAFSRAKKTWERRKENEQRVPCRGRNRNCIRFIHPREVERSRGTFLVKFSSPRPIPIRIDRPLTRSNSGGPRVGSGRGSSRKKRGWVWLAPTLGVLRQWQRGGRGAGGRPVLSPVVRGPFHQPRSARGLSSLALSTTLPIVVSFDHVYHHHTSKSNGFPANNRCGPLITAYLVNQGIRSIPKLESPRARVSGDFNAGPNDRVLLLSF